MSNFGKLPKTFYKPNGGWKSLICWIFGHKLSGSLNIQQNRWMYHCNRCKTKDFWPDTRNIFFRIYRDIRYFLTKDISK